MQNLNTLVSFYPTAFCKDEEIKELSLLNVIARITKGKYKKEVEALRAEKSKTKKQDIKSKLPCFTPSGTFEGKKSETLKQHSGYLLVDIDSKDNAGLENFADLKELCANIPYIMYCAHSCGGEGFMCLIAIKDPTKHTEYFKAIQRAFAACGVVIDKSCKDIARKRYFSYDPLPYLNTGALTFDDVLPPEHKTEFQRTETTEEIKAKTEFLVDIIGRECIDVCGNYDQWFSILASLANEFGESGREYAHVISEPGATYKDAADVDRRFNDALKHKDLKYTIATFFKFANDGIKAERLARDFEHINSKTEEEEEI